VSLGSETAGEWTVIAVTTHSSGKPENATEDTVLARGGEDEARQVYSDVVADAAERGYEKVTLQADGRTVEQWPQATGWTS